MACNDVVSSYTVVHAISAAVITVTLLVMSYTE